MGVPSASASRTAVGDPSDSELNANTSAAATRRCTSARHPSTWTAPVRPWSAMAARTSASAEPGAPAIASCADGSSRRTSANASTRRCWPFSGTSRAALTINGRVSSSPSSTRLIGRSPVSTSTPRGTTVTRSGGMSYKRQLPSRAYTLTARKWTSPSRAARRATTCIVRPFQPATPGWRSRCSTTSPVRLNDETTGMRNVAAASWPTRLAENSDVWTTSGRHPRSAERSRTAAHGHVRPARPLENPSATTGTPAASTRPWSSSRPYSRTTRWSNRPVSASTSSTSRSSAPPVAASESTTCTTRWSRHDGARNVERTQSSTASSVACWVATEV